MTVLRIDQDLAKGATEAEEHTHDGNIGLAGQLGHRDQDPRIKGYDTDFPEPGGSPEHSGTRRKANDPAGKSAIARFSNLTDALSSRPQLEPQRGRRGGPR